MTFARDLSGNNPIDLKYSPSSRTAADLTAILALTQQYPGEIVMALNTGRKYRALGGTTWGLIGPVTSVIAGTLPQPSVTINQAAGQADPTGTSPILFTVVFTQDVTGFTTGDVTLAGTVGGTLVGAVSGGPNTYTVSVTGMTTAGTVIASIGAGVATGPGGANLASTSVDNIVAWTVVGPSVTIEQAAGQTEPTNVSPILFTATFSEAVTGFTTGDVTFTPFSSAGGTLVGTISGGPTVYTVSVTGMTTAGAVVANIAASVATSVATGAPNSAGTHVDNTVAWQPDVTRPSVTINQGASQSDPTSGSSIVFDVVFSEPVVTIGSGAINVTFTCGGTPSVSVVMLTQATYTVTVTGMAAPDGNVSASIPAGATTDAASLPNFASTSTDNVVTWTSGGGGGFPDSTTSANEFPILFI
jgi:hypothetical protein